jgi:hypothetical protein
MATAKGFGIFPLRAHNNGRKIFQPFLAITLPFHWLCLVKDIRSTIAEETRE